MNIYVGRAVFFMASAVERNKELPPPPPPPLIKQSKYYDVNLSDDLHKNACPERFLWHTLLNITAIF